MPAKLFTTRAGYSLFWSETDHGNVITGSLPRNTVLTLAEQLELVNLATWRARLAAVRHVLRQVLNMEAEHLAEARLLGGADVLRLTTLRQFVMHIRGHRVAKGSIVPTWPRRALHTGWL